MAETGRGGGQVMAVLEGLKRPLRPLIFSALHRLRTMPAGRACARFGRERVPGAYAAVLRRYHAYGLAATAPPRHEPGPSFAPPRLAGLSAEEALVARRLALAQHVPADRR